MFRSVPPATRALILINVVVYLLELYRPNQALEIFALWPLHAPLFRWWQLVTYAFLHDPSQWLHIFFNMFALFMFGRGLEQYWGSRRFLGYYFVCLLSAALTQLAVENAGGALEPVLGASGAIFGVLFAFAWYFPRTRLILIPIPIPMPAWLFVTLYGLLELFFGVTGTVSNVAHFAHLGGMAGGALCILYWRLRRRFEYR
jgi:membrane associated rhomboid family serine protease